MALYSYIFGLLIACVSYIVYKNYVNVYPSIVIKPEKRYDYVIVGAGTAGCVLASRLTDDPKVTVLLVEAGEHMGYFTKVPLTATAAQLGPSDWSVVTASQKFSSFGLIRQKQFLPRGKGLGGSSQINFLLHGLGFPEDFQRWHRLGFKAWTVETLKPYFLKAFGTDKSEFDSEHCSIDGVCPGIKAPMHLKLVEETNELMRTFREASSILRDNVTTFRKATATVKDGARFLTLDAYLKPALKRRNLHVLLKTQAVSIRFINRKVSSIFILQNHRELDNIFVNKEIILAAGAIKTPQLLMLSGIGPKEVLKKLKVPVVLENQHVGRNLHDHMNMPVYVSAKSPVTVTLAKVFTFSTFLNYFWRSSGLLSFPPVPGVEYHNKSAVMLFSMGSASERLLREISNYKSKVFRDTFPFHSDSSAEGFMFLCTCAQPRSRGSVVLTESSVASSPVVDPRYLEKGWDVECMVRAMRRAEKLVQAKPFQDIGAQIHWPRPERCLTLWNYTKDEQMDKLQKRKRKVRTKVPGPHSPPDAYLECILREVAVTGHHVGGTCAGGTVVDDQLRVKGLSGLRVMDASVFPSPVSLYPNSVLIAMAERAADLIRYT